MDNLLIIEQSNPEILVRVLIALGTGCMQGVFHPLRWMADGSLWLDKAACCKLRFISFSSDPFQNPDPEN